MPSASGPLAGVRVLEFAGLGPAPFCAMLLSDLGADVITVARPGAAPPSPEAVTQRGRCHLPLDLKDESDRSTCLDLVGRADILIEGFRPGVMERLGLGPDVALARNPALVFGRMTGWGQDGPYAQMAGHDINYIAITGALHAIGPADKPIPPLNLVGDFGGGALYLGLGVLAALVHARATGEGQVVDAAITDGAASLMAMQYGYLAAGRWTDRRESNRLDGGAHFYDSYRCADGEWIALGPIEPAFYAELLRLVGLDGDRSFADQLDVTAWPALKRKLAERIASEPRAHWCAVLEGSDACFAPIMSMTEAPSHPQNVARGTFLTRDGVVQPAPAPRLSRTPGAIQDGVAGQAAVAGRLAAWRGTRVNPEALLSMPPLVTEHRYAARDTILYALGVGAGQDGDPRDLRYLYEDGLVALPTMAVVLAYPGFWQKQPEYEIDWRRVLHVGQSVLFHGALPVAGAVRGETRIENIIDKGADRGALLTVRREIVDADSGLPLATVRQTSLLRGDGGVGGSPRSPAQAPQAVPDRAADVEAMVATRPEQALLYRLSGDDNPLHADPQVAAQAGLPRPILHGLCTFGIAGRYLLRAILDDAPERLSRLDCRFTRPVFPGDTLLVQAWATGPGRTAFRVTVPARDVVALDNGLMEFLP